MLTLEHRLAARVQALDYQEWRNKVHAVNGCARPIRLAGAHQLQDPTGKVLHHHGGDIFAPCGNRRAAVCPSCSDRYAADAFHLIRAGLVRRAQGHPRDRHRPAPRVRHPHRPLLRPRPPRRAPPAPGQARSRAACGEYHHDDDTRIGTPLDPETYDYAGSVLWQATPGDLWQRFTIRLRREIANAPDSKPATSPTTPGSPTARSPNTNGAASSTSTP